MLKGYNSDISYMGISYHVQTEDWGPSASVLMSRVFRNGAVLQSVKTRYQDVLPLNQSTNEQAIRLALKAQHQKILDLLLSGQLV